MVLARWEIVLSTSPWEVDEKTPLIQLVRGMDDSDRWEDAGLSSCVKYLANSRKLEVPRGFQSLVADYVATL